MTEPRERLEDLGSHTVGSSRVHVMQTVGKRGPEHAYHVKVYRAEQSGPVLCARMEHGEMLALKIAMTRAGL